VRIDSASSSAILGAVRLAIVTLAVLTVAAATLALVRLDAAEEAQAAPVRESATFARLAQPTSGRATLVLRGDVRRLTFPAFRTKAAPDLYVYLVPGKGRGGDIAGGIRLARLKAVWGPQQYRIPKSVNVEMPVAVVIWCALCEAAWGHAQLT
jgi:hypothetical protein